jgi:glycosyltransferase involved in cell wall biosynthesis
MTQIKIGFVLLSNSQQPMPSTRIVVLNMFPFLRRSNIDPHIVFEPEESAETPDVSGLASYILSEGFHIVFFQKVHGPSVVELVHQLSDAGVKTVYSVCDLVNVEMATATDLTIVVTDYLKSLYPQLLHQKIRVVHDGIEHPEVCKYDWGKERSSYKKKLHALLVTSAALDHLPILGTPPKWLEVTIVGRYPKPGQLLQRLREMRWKYLSLRGSQKHIAYLDFLTCQSIHRVAWDPVGVYCAMMQADIGIIPITTTPDHEAGQTPPSWKVKSENRLTMKMCAGLPVIATPIPAYERVIDQGNNGYLARSKAEWLEYLDALRDPFLRRTIGNNARESVLSRYSKQEQARCLIKIFVSLMESEVNVSG